MSLSFTSSHLPIPSAKKLGVREAMNGGGVGCGGRLEAKHITQSLSPELNCLSPERLEEPEWRFGSRILVPFLLPHSIFFAIFLQPYVLFHPDLSICPPEPPFQASRFLPPFSAASGGAGAWGLGLHWVRALVLFALLTVPSSSFLNVPSFPASHRVSSSPTAWFLQLLARGPGGSRNPKRMRPLAGATSPPPAGQRLRALGGGAGRHGEAGAARERRGRGPMGSAEGGGGGAVRAEGRGPSAVAGEPGRPRRLSLLRPSHPRGSSVGLTPAPKLADRARGSCVRSRPRQPFSARPRTVPSASCAVRGLRAGGVLRGGAGVRCGRLRGRRRWREPECEGVKSGCGVRRLASASGLGVVDLGGHLRGGRALEWIWGAKGGGFTRRREPKCR